MKEKSFSTIFVLKELPVLLHHHEKINNLSNIEQNYNSFVSLHLVNKCFFTNFHGKLKNAYESLSQKSAERKESVTDCL